MCNQPRQVERGIDSMSKGVNSSLISGRAYRGDASDGDKNGNVEDNEHGDKLGFYHHHASKEEYTIHSCQSISTFLYANSVHVA